MTNAQEIFGFLGAAASIVAAGYSFFKAYAHTRAHARSRTAVAGSLAPLTVDPGLIRVTRAPLTVALEDGSSGNSIAVMAAGDERLAGPSEPEDNLANLSYRLLKEERYDSVIMLSEFIDTNKLAMSDEHLMFLINLAQAYKWKGSQEACEKILQMEFWRKVDNNVYLLAHLVLKNEFLEAGNVMKSVSTEKIDKKAYIRWPLFREFRKTIGFQRAYRALFNEFPPS